MAEDQEQIDVVAKANAAPKMPPEIARAIIAVAKKIKMLGKDEQNQFAKFDYVSVDKFYGAVGPMMAEAGLFTICHENTCASAERKGADGKTAIWLTFVYDIYLYHESGIEHGPLPRTIMVPATGPQAFGSGLSYVEKYFLRSLFKIPTGEKDADAEAQQGLPAVNKQQAPKPKPGFVLVNLDGEAIDILDPNAARKAFVELLALAAGRGKEAVDGFWESNTLSAQLRQAGFAALADQVVSEYETALRRFSAGKPHQIPLPVIDGQPGYMTFARNFIDTIKTAVLLSELRAWWAENKASLQECQKNAPKAFDSVQRAFTAMQEKVSPAMNEEEARTVL